MQPFTGGKGVRRGVLQIILFATLDYYIIGSAHGWFEVNPVSWLATRASTMGPSYPLRIARFDPAQEKNYMYSETSIWRNAKGLGKLVPYIEISLYRNLDWTNLRKNNQNVRHIEVWLIIVVFCVFFLVWRWCT